MECEPELPTYLGCKRASEKVGSLKEADAPDEEVPGIPELEEPEVNLDSASWILRRSSSRRSIPDVGALDEVPAERGVVTIPAGLGVVTIPVGLGVVTIPSEFAVVAITSCMAWSTCEGDCMEPEGLQR